MVKKSRRVRISRDDRAFYIGSGIFLTVLLALVIYPLVYVLSASFSSGAAVSSGQVTLLPVGFNWEGYAAVFKNTRIPRAYLNTILYTLAGTFINIGMVMSAAYPLARADLRGRKFLMLFFTFTMLFSGGMIPLYILIHHLRMMDTVWAMVIPGALPVYSMIIARTYIQTSIPAEMLEAAGMDGCSDARFFFQMVLPLSGACIAVTALFCAVGHWNAYFGAMMYLNSPELVPLQLVLRDILVMNQVDTSMLTDAVQARDAANLSHVLKYSLIVVAAVPILCVYPFIQKYFVTGVMVGSLKG